MPLRGPAAMLGQPTLGIVVDRRLNYEFKWGMGARLSSDIVFAEGHNIILVAKFRVTILHLKLYLIGLERSAS